MIPLAHHTALEGKLQSPVPFLQMLIGPRQVGKTTVAQRIFEDWRGPKFFHSADSPSPPSADWIEMVWRQAQSQGKDTLLVIDEIQKIAGWSEIVKKLHDYSKPRLKVLLLGSSSMSLQRGMTESLAGRFELTRAFHWSYAECHRAFDWDFATYLRYGGYPGAAQLAAEPERWRAYMLDGIIEPVLSRDIIGQNRIDKPALFRQCFELCLNYPAQELSLNKMLGILHDRGNVTTLKYYLELLQGAFLISCLYQYSASPLRPRQSPPKIIPMCPALITAFQSEQRPTADPAWRGRILEAAVGAHLVRIPAARLSYWRKGEYEVDFVVKTPGALHAIEIKSSDKWKLTGGLMQFQKKFRQARCEVWDEYSCRDFLAGKRWLEP